MSFLDKLNVFKRRNDDLSFLDQPPPAQDLHMGAPDPMMHQDPLGSADPLASHDPMMGHHIPENPNFAPTQQSFGQPDHRMQMPLGDSLRSHNQQHHVPMYQELAPKEQTHHNPLEKDLEIIASKLDYLRASLDSINQRLVNVEHMVREDINSKQWQK